MPRRSLFLAPLLALAIAAVPGTAAAGSGKAGGSHVQAKKADTPVWGKGRPAGTGGGRRIR